jgi:hypothetical protein
MVLSQQHMTKTGQPRCVRLASSARQHQQTFLEFVEVLGGHKSLKKEGIYEYGVMREELVSLCGNVEITRLLVDHGTGVTAQAEDSPPFSVAKWKYGSLTFLVKYDADVTAENKGVLIPFTPGITSGDTRMLDASLSIIGKKLL